MIPKTALLLLLAASFGSAASHKISRDLAAVPADRQVDVIVIVWGDTGLAPNIVWGDHALLAN